MKKVDSSPPKEVLTILETLPDLYLILSVDLVVLFANQAYLRATNTQPDDIIGRPIFEVFPDTPAGNQVELAQESLQQVLTTRKPHKTDPIRYDLSPAQGSGRLLVRYWRVHNTPVLNESGNIRYIIQQAYDITEEVATETHEQAIRDRQRQHQDETEQQLSLLEALLDQSPVAICLFQGTDLVVASANQQICAMWGYPVNQVLGRPLLDAVPELKGQGFDALLQEVLMTGVAYRGTEMPAQMLQDGQLKTTYYNFVYHPLRDEQGDVIGVVDVAIDVTEQVEARQQIEQSHQKEHALNEELAASNEELRATNEELEVARQSLERLNSELEARVATRTQELERAQSETNRQKELLEGFFRQSSAGICILSGPNLVYELINPAYQRLFPGLTLVGKPLLEALPGLADQPIWPTLQKVYQTGETFEGREVLVALARREGEAPEDIYFNFTYQPRFDKQGQVDGIQILVYDVTEQVLARQRAEELTRQVQHQAQTFDTILTALPDYVYTFDTQGRFTYGNKMMLDILNVTLNELVGKGFYELPYSPELADTLHAHVARVVATGQPLTDETSYTDQKGNLGYYEYIFRPVFDSQRQVIAVAGSTRDVTQRKQSAEELRHKNGELLRINADLDNFVYSASHDLKAPITNIQGLLNMLHDELLPENQADATIQEILGMMEQSVARFIHTIADLSEITRFQKQSQQPAELVNLPQVVENVQMDLAMLIEQSKAKIEVDLDRCPPILFSPKNLRSVVYNLLSNAIKYRDPDRSPRVQVGCKKSEEYTVLTVSDNGLGMDLSQDTKLFGMFQRLHNHVEGTGIGLYIVKKVIENAGGKIAVESQLGRGTTFTVFFKQ